MTTELMDAPIALDTALEVSGLRQRYGDFEAVRGISFTVRKGELFALLGSNGAGKTTTMEVLEGFRPATSGKVSVLGHDPYRQRRAISPRIGILLQESGLLTDLTVAETVDLWRDLHRNPRDREDILGLVELDDKTDVRVRQLSGGQKRRLDLALALIGRPEVLFLDEPTTGMDPEARRTTWNLIGGLLSEGTTVLLTTHYLEEAEQLASRLAIMHRGVIRVTGAIDDVLAGRGDRIHFDVPSRVSVDDLPLVSGVAPEISLVNGVPVATYTVIEGRRATRAYEALKPLFSWADQRGVELERLGVRTASLEDVFHSTVEE